MEKTIVIDGVEYILTPKNPPKEEAKKEPSILDDYMIQEEEVVEAPQEPQSDSPVMIVKNTDGVQSAVPRESEYRKRFVERTIRPQDITARQNPHMLNLRDFKELPEIAQADTGSDRIPSGLGGFYGPGIERDIY